MTSPKLTPLTLLLAALALLVLLGICHALGLRDHVPALSGNAGPASLAGALLYVAAFLAAVVLAPILLLAAALFQLFLHLAASAHEGTRTRNGRVDDSARFR